MVNAAGVAGPEHAGAVCHGSCGPPGVRAGRRSFAAGELAEDAVLVPRIAKRLTGIRLPAGRLPVNHGLVVVTGLPVATVLAMLDDPLVQDQADALALGIDNGYRSYTATLLRQLVMPRHHLVRPTIPGCTAPSRSPCPPASPPTRPSPPSWALIERIDGGVIPRLGGLDVFLCNPAGEIEVCGGDVDDDEVADHVIAIVESRG